jgi:hypothetical protein
MMGTTKDEKDCSKENDTRRVAAQHTKSLVETTYGKKQRNPLLIEEAYEGNNSNKKKKRMESGADYRSFKKEATRRRSAHT